jgi:hypothetical protein
MIHMNAKASERAATRDVFTMQVWHVRIITYMAGAEAAIQVSGVVPSIENPADMTVHEALVPG